MCLFSSVSETGGRSPKIVFCAEPPLGSFRGTRSRRRTTSGDGLLRLRPVFFTLRPAEGKASTVPNLRSSRRPCWRRDSGATLSRFDAVPHRFEWLIPRRHRRRPQHLREHAEPGRSRAPRRRARAEAGRSLPDVNDAPAVSAEIVIEVRQVRADRGEGRVDGAGAGHGG